MNMKLDVRTFLFWWSKLIIIIGFTIYIPKAV